MYRIGTLVTVDGEQGVFEIVEMRLRKDEPTLYKLREKLNENYIEIWEATENHFYHVKCENCKYFQDGDSPIRECELKNVWVRPYDFCERFVDSEWQK